LNARGTNLVDAAGVDGRGFFFLAVGNFDRKIADIGANANQLTPFSAIS
jgi:hypothetical protein